MSDLEALKKEAACRAADLIKSGQRVGLGTGSTAKYAIEELGRKLASGELSNIVGVATSQASETLALSLGIKVEPLSPQVLDIAIDGADEIAPNLDLIKGLGGALVREKLTEVQAKRLIIIADHTKLVSKLGEKAPLPIEILQFGFLSTVERLRKIIPAGSLRQTGAQPYLTDNSNYIYDAQLPAEFDAAELEQRLKSTLGVVDTGFFLGMADMAFIATPTGLQTKHRGE